MIAASWTPTLAHTNTTGPGLNWGHVMAFAIMLMIVLAVIRELRKLLNI